MKIASAQILIHGGDWQGNLQRAVAAIGEAKGLGADIVVLPECSNFGWTHISAQDFAVEIEEDGFVSKIRELAKKLDIYVAFGFVERGGDELFNSAILVNNRGEILAHHRKIHELDFAQELYATGTSITYADTQFGRIGLMICADALSETDSVIEKLVGKEVNIILSPSSWAVPADHDNFKNPYGSLWVDAYRRGLNGGKTWIVATSNVGKVEGGHWDGYLCIGNSISIGPDLENFSVLSYGANATEIGIIKI